MKQLTIFNRVKNKVLFYILTLITHPLFLLLIIITIYILLFVFFFADTVLCQGEGIPSQSEELVSASHASQEKISELKERIEHYTAQGVKCKAEYLH
jgi:hypothetical protein